MRLGFEINEKKVIDLYVKKKESVKAIAEMFGCDRSPIDRILKKCKIKIRSPSETSLGFEIDEKKVIALYVKKKKSAKAIAEMFGCSITVIIRILTKNCIHRRSSREEILGFEIDEKKVITLYVEKKKSAKAIAGMLGCKSEQPIYSVLEKNGIERRSGSEARRLVCHANRS